MSPISVPAPKHIPAWKKLGLRLKFAKEDVDEGEQHVVINSKKRTASNSGNDFPAETVLVERPAKKPKKMKSKKIIPPQSDTLESAERVSPQAVTTPSLKSKSVSFTPETKTEDGEGVKQLYQTWLDKQIAHDPSFDPSTVSPALKSIAPATAASDEAALHLKSFTTASTDSSLKEPKKKKPKTKTQIQTSQFTSPSTDHPALVYLQTYHTAPQTWKFSKPQQNYLLRHLFSLTHIPPSYELALLSYLRGLQGSARARIRQQALAIREEDGKWLSTEAAEDQKMEQETTEQCLARMKQDYDAAVARIKKQLREKEQEREEKEWELAGGKQEWEERVKKRRRAEIVLWGVGEDEEVVEDTVALPSRAIFGNSRAPVGVQAVTIQSRGMGGVRQISNSGIAEGSVGKKIVFEDDGAKQVGAANGVQKMNGVNGIKKVDTQEGVNGVQTKPPRKRKRRRRTGVPDDDSSSSSSDSSSSSEESEEEKVMPPKGNPQYHRIGKGDVGGSETSNSDSDSSSGSGTSSSGDSDSD